MNQSEFLEITESTRILVRARKELRIQGAIGFGSDRLKN